MDTTHAHEINARNDAQVDRPTAQIVEAVDEVADGTLRVGLWPVFTLAGRDAHMAVLWQKYRHTRRRAGIPDGYRFQVAMPPGEPAEPYHRDDFLAVPPCAKVEGSKMPSAEYRSFLQARRALVKALGRHFGACLSTV